MSMSREMHDHYSSCEERERLSLGAGRLELLRSQEIITRFLPDPPAVILDVGGGPGRQTSRTSIASGGAAR